MIVGIMGKAGSGKDTAADMLVERFQFVRVALADPLKRFCEEVFEFTPLQLWGPSEQRNAPDSRYPRTDLLPAGPPTAIGNTGFTRQPLQRVTADNLSPRYALQTLGTEWGRHCYENVWADYAMRVAHRLLADDGVKKMYSARGGLVVYDHGKLGWDRQQLHLQEQANGSPYVPEALSIAPKGVAIPDVRFKNEVEAIQRAKGLVVRIVRPGAGLSGDAGRHVSETEQESVPDSSLDYVLKNDGTLEVLEQRVAQMVDVLRARVQPSLNFGL